MLLSIVNLAFVSCNLLIANRQNGRAEWLASEQMRANLPRLSLRVGQSKGSYIVRNVGTQPAWAISWALVPLAPDGFPTGFKAGDLNSHLRELQPLQPSSLGGHDETTITIDPNTISALCRSGRAGLLIDYGTIDPYLNARALFALDNGGTFIRQTVSTN